MMAQRSGESSSSSNILACREATRDHVGLHSKHKIFLSHTGAQKDFVEQLCVDLERWDRHPFFDKRRDSLPIGENFPQHIFAAIRQCQVGVVILSEEFFTRKWPMIELASMVQEAKERGLGFKILPVFLGLSISVFRDLAKRNGWRSRWCELALMDNRIDVQEWADALKYLEPVNSMVYDGLGEVKFRKEIVDVLCGAVPLETRMEDSHIQGRSRLCKVIQERIEVLVCTKNEGVVVVGLYGMGGIGKTSICKALCNEYVARFHGRVCHAELEKKSKEELLRDVLKRLTDTSHELLDRWNEDELLGKLNSGIIKEPIFLAIDNVSDVQVSIDEAKCYVLAWLPSGSIVLVTSRSKETLKCVRADLVDKAVMEMPELDYEEARSLFCRSYEMESRCKIDEVDIKRCVQLCYFRKGNGNYHYHPLTLDVLGKQLACVDAEDWEAYLDKIDGDILSGSGEVDHVIFSILRKSYDLLNLNDRLLFMDVALFLPYHIENPDYRVNAYEWLGMVHGLSVDDVVCVLKRLRRKSLLENLGDGMGTDIGMHDLWRAFCEAEGQSGEPRHRCCVYGTMGNNMELIERCPAGGYWENVARINFFDSNTWNELERVNFSHFPNVSVLQISLLFLEKKLVLDLSGLECLKSLDIFGVKTSKLDLVGLPRCLVFLRVIAIPYELLGCSGELVKQVRYLTKLEYLYLGNSVGDKFPDIRSMVLLRVAIFFNWKNVVTFTGLGTELSNLRVLHFIDCSKLKSCPGAGNLVGLEELKLYDCPNLKRLPNLGKMRNLRKLSVTECRLITEVPGLDDLVALEELYANQKYFRLPDMSKLKKLRVMRMHGCRLETLSGFDSLVSLEEVKADFGALLDKPSLRQLTKLQSLKFDNGWHLQGLNELNNLAILRDLRIGGCFGVGNLPDIQGLIGLQALTIMGCGFKGVDGLSNLTALERLDIMFCEMLERVPDLQKLTRLKLLKIRHCPMLRRWDRTVGPVERSSYRSINNYVGSEVPDSEMLIALRTLHLSECPLFEDVMLIGALSGLERIEYSGGLDAVIEFPDLSCFPRLKTLNVEFCERLQRLTAREPIHTLTVLRVEGCSSLMALPDLSSFPGLVRLEVYGCKRLPRLSISEPLRSLLTLTVQSRNGQTCGVKEVPDLGMFPTLKTLSLEGCSELTSVRSSVPLPALTELDAGWCTSVKELPDLGMFPSLKTLWLTGCTELTSLRSSVPLPEVTHLDARGCTSLSGADLDNLQVLCPRCKIKLRDVVHNGSDVVHDVEFERGRFQQILRCFRS